MNRVSNAALLPWQWTILLAFLVLMPRDSWFVSGGSASYSAGRPWGMPLQSQGRIFPSSSQVSKYNDHFYSPLLDHSKTPNPSIVLRGGAGYGHASYSPPTGIGPTPSSFVKLVGTITQLLISAGKVVLPTMVAVVKGVVKIYRALPLEAIVAQVGLVYCFLGGYYPTLFSSLQAAKYCGWHIAVKAISELTEEALVVIDELEAQGVWDSGGYKNGSDQTPHNPRDIFLKQTHIVLTTVDPAKINTAAGALYTTWLGISTILRREYARVINLSLTLAEGMEQVGKIVVEPAVRLVIPRDYHRWVPVLLGWSAKAAAMRIAWRIERVLTAATSAIAGGAMVARSLTKYMTKQRLRNQQQKASKKQRSMVVANTTTNAETVVHAMEDEDELSIQEQMVGFAVGGLGFYTQMETQYRQKFNFVVPFPMSLVTWPFDLAERWIQWYITEKAPK